MLKTNMLTIDYQLKNKIDTFQKETMKLQELFADWLEESKDVSNPFVVPTISILQNQGNQLLNDSNALMSYIQSQEIENPQIQLLVITNCVVMLNRMLDSCDSIMLVHNNHKKLKQLLRSKLV